MDGKLIIVQIQADVAYVYKPEVDKHKNQMIRAADQSLSTIFF